MTFQENILFGLPYDYERYDAVIEVRYCVEPRSMFLDHFFVRKACALVHDLNVLEDGDECEVGEHGVSRAPFAPNCKPSLEYFARRLISQAAKKREVRKSDIFSQNIVLKQ
jgi:hypothetical protein